MNDIGKYVTFGTNFRAGQIIGEEMRADGGYFTVKVAGGQQIIVSIRDIRAFYDSKALLLGLKGPDR